MTTTSGAGSYDHPDKQTMHETDYINATYGFIVHQEKANDHWFSLETEISLVVAFCVVLLLGLFGNSLVCVVLYRNTDLRSPRNLLILNLSVCDVIMCLVCMPFSLVRLTLKNWPFGTFFCKLGPSLQMANVFVSTFSIVAIAFDRYKSIVCGAREQYDQTRRRIFFTIALIWCTAVVLSLPVFLFHVVHATDMNLYNICVEDWSSDLFRVVYTTVVMVIQYLSPCLVITVLHARICHFLRLRISVHPVTEAENKRALKDFKRHRRNLLLLTAVAMTFSVTWLPITALNVTADFDYLLFHDQNFNLMYAICLLIAMVSVGVNPLFYGWFNVNFRHAFYDLLCMTREVNRGDSSEENRSRGKSVKYESFQVGSSN